MISVTDPSTGNVQYFASDLSSYTHDMTVDDVLQLMTDGLYDEEGVSVYTPTDGTEYPGVYVEPNGHLYETTAASQKDLEKIDGFMEAYDLQKNAERLATDFGLSEARSLKVAKFFNAYKKVSNKRAMTAADAELFSLELTGAGFDSIKSAVTDSIKGDDSAYDALIEKAAEKNEINLEHMKEVLETLF